MALLNVLQDSPGGTTAAYTAVSASDTISLPPSGGRYMLIVKNAGGTADVVTIADPTLSLAGNAGTARTITVPITTGERWIALQDADINPSTGLVTVSHSFTTSVTCAVVGT